MEMQVTEQATTPSVEERAAAALFGSPKPQAKAPPQETAEEQPEGEESAPEAELPEETQAATGEEAPPIADETFEFEHEGTKYAIPKALEKQFQNNRDYTQKSQEIAHQRRSFEILNEQARISSMQRQFEQENGDKLQKLMAYDAVLKQPVDWQSMDTNTAFQRKLQIDTWKDERDAIARELDSSYQQWTHKQNEALSGLKAKVQEVLTKRIPGWNAEVEKAVRAHAASDGYTEAELNQIGDPRHLTTLWKAQQYDQLKAKASTAVTQVKSIKTTPSNPMPQAVKDKLNFRKQLAKTVPGSMERQKTVEARAASFFEKR